MHEIALQFWTICILQVQKNTIWLFTNYCRELFSFLIIMCFFLPFLIFLFPTICIHCYICLYQNIVFQYSLFIYVYLSPYITTYFSNVVYLFVYVYLSPYSITHFSNIVDLFVCVYLSAYITTYFSNIVYLFVSLRPCSRLYMCNYSTKNWQSFIHICSCVLSVL